MQPLKIFSVIPRLPKELSPLWELAYNFWFEWNHEISDLFAQMDQVLWRKSRRNPVWFLNHLPQQTIGELAGDAVFLERLNQISKDLKRYTGKTTSPLSFAHRNGNQPVVAYFSAEYGLGLSLPVYSGGLGVLAGDHLKSASDLNLPLVGIGLCYQQGYFRQYLTQDGWQQERYTVNDFDQMPLDLVLDTHGKPVRVSVTMQGQNVIIQIWRAIVGRISLFLLDTNIPENPPHFREITAQLYGGGLEMRIRQEIVLGIGGVKALQALNLKPQVIHMNEGHSAFAGLERIKVFMAENDLTFESALELVASSSVFTTHTPVPAGNDRFPPDMMERYFSDYSRELNLAFKVFLALGRENPRDDGEPFCMTVLALRLSRFNNGVSELHSEVSKKLWSRVWPQYPTEDIPIGAVTNGVHIPTWVPQDFATMFDRYLGSNWREDPDCHRIWQQAEYIPDAELWRTHERLRERLIDFVRRRLREQVISRGGRGWELQMAEEILNPTALTVGFARRFATYKRANLILQDKSRLMKILENKHYPVQFIFAGKAHPQDVEGKKIIQQILELCHTSECRYNMVFLEDYDLELASYMVQGCDVWLNNPRPPLEACGTSGMKAMANGVLNLSTLDGWWAEAYAPDNSLGWSIGNGEVYEDHGYQDVVESQILYNLLEREIIPLFYERGHGNLPRRWVEMMKKCLRLHGPVFNSHRMVEQYAASTYIPAHENFYKLSQDRFQPAKDLASWRMKIMTEWNQIRIRNVTAKVTGDIFVGEKFTVRAEVLLNGLERGDVQAEIYSGPVDYEGNFSSRTTDLMQPTDTTGDGWHVFEGVTSPDQTGRYGFTVRLLPHHPLLLDPHSLGLIHWGHPE
ncbi:MAG: alpha-glucan family phosphorylase [Desulfovibrionales bacterium]